MNLMQGDCLERMQELPNESIDMVMCDPPYGFTPAKWDKRIDFQSMWAQILRVTKPTGAIVMNCVQPFTTELIHSNLEIFKYCWAWDKGSPSGHLNAKKMPMKKIEDIAVFYRKPCTYNPQGLIYNPRKKSRNSETVGSLNYSEHGSEYTALWSGYPTNLIKFKNENGLHPKQRPVALIEYLINTYTNENECVLDFAMGSGTTGVACIRTKRNFVGIELLPKCFKIAKDRIQKVTEGA